MPSHTWAACPNHATCSLSQDGHANPPPNPPGGAHNWAICKNRANCPLSQSGHGIPIDELQSPQEN
jgi:hypothetical protein